MKRVLLLLAAASGLWAQPVVSNIRVTDTSHSTARITWDTNATAAFHRLRYGSTTSYEGSTYGGIQPASYQGNISSNIQAVWSGGHYSTTMHFCPQSSFDNSTWSACVDTTFASPALPGTHPAVPIAPSTFSTTFPNTAGYTEYDVAVGCANLATQLAAAETTHAATGAIVVMPVGGCPTNNLYFPGAADAKYFTTANVNTGTNTITYNAHGFVNGNQLAFGADQRIGPFPAGLQATFIYYACNVTTNTFQVCNDSGGTSIVSLLDVGHTGQCVVDVTTQSTKQVLVVPEWPLGTNFRVPTGVRYDSTAQSTWAGTATAKFYLNTLGTTALGFTMQQCLHHWRMMTEITTGSTSELGSDTTDPTPWGTLGFVAADTANIIFDRAWIHGQDFPNRTLQGIKLLGRNQAIIDSEVDNLSYWLSSVKVSTDLEPTLSGGGSVLTFSTGKYMLGYQTCTLGTAATFTITSGTPTGNLLGYYSMDCVLHVVGPSTLAGTCVRCTYSTSASPAFPIDGMGNRASGRVAQVTVTSGSMTAITNNFKPYQGGLSAYTGGEGPTGILGLCAFGRGPTMIVNNKIEAAGIGLHSDDSCTSVQYTNPGTDITINRNLFTLRLSWVPSDPSFDERLREVRNELEFKKGLRIAITGNTFEHQWASVTPQGYAVSVFPTKAFSGTGDPQVTDVNISNNSALNVSAAFQLAAGIPGSTGITPALLRIGGSGNLARTYATMYDPALKDGTTLYGFCWFVWGAIEDSTLDHDTCLTDGLGAFFAYNINQQDEGYVNSNGIYVVNDPLGRLGYGLEIDFTPILPATPVTFGKAILDWVATQGAGNPVYTFNPVLVPWTTATVANWTTGWSGTSATVVTGASGAARVAAVQFTDFAGGDYSLSSGSPYHNAALDGMDFGTLFETLNPALGEVGTPSVNVTGNTTATITTTTPDTFACPILYSLDNWTSFSQQAGAASTTQAINLTSLSAATLYRYVVACAVEQMTGTFTTTGSPLGDATRNSTAQRGGTTIR